MFCVESVRRIEQKLDRSLQNVLFMLCSTGTVSPRVANIRFTNNSFLRMLFLLNIIVAMTV